MKLCIAEDEKREFVKEYLDKQMKKFAFAGIENSKIFPVLVEDVRQVRGQAC